MIESFSQFSATIEPLLLIGASVGIAILALAIYRHDHTSATNRIFAALSISMMLWIAMAYISGLGLSNALLFHRLSIVFAAPTSTFLFLLAYTLPNARIQMKRYVFWLVLFLTVLMMAINLSSYAFVGLSATGSPIPGPALIFFGILSTLFSILAVFYLVKKSFTGEGIARLQMRTVLIGMIIMLAFVIGTVLIPIVVFNSTIFVPFIPLYVLIFLGMTAYAITKYQLFAINVLVTQALTFVIWVVLFAKIFVDSSLNAQILDGLVFILTIIFGFFLIRSVKREVEQRQLIEKQEQELEVANAQQENLLHFISHEVKGYLTKAGSAFAMIEEGDYGPTSPELHNLVTVAFADNRKGVATVMDILNASNLKKGTVTYTMHPFDMKEAVKTIVAEHQSAAKEKNISLEFSAPEGNYMMVGDGDQLQKHAINNIIDNAIKYTPQGKVEVSLSRTGEVIIFSVQDSGVGITDEDKKRLFTAGGHGKDSIKVNTHSTGYGLFITKSIIDAHKGKISASSQGAGKGSIFTMELPTNLPATATPSSHESIVTTPAPTAV